MAAINQFTIVGHLCRDVELRYTAGGTPCACYAVAVRRARPEDSTAAQQECDFIPVRSYARQAQYDARFLKKGSAVAVSGRIRSWYQRERNRGGFLFEALCVQYLGPSAESAGAARGAVDAALAEHAEWLRDYESAEMAGGGPVRRSQVFSQDRN